MASSYGRKSSFSGPSHRGGKSGGLRMDARPSARAARTSAPRPATPALRSGGPLSGLPLPALLAGVVAILAVVGVVVLLILSQLPVFTITSIDAKVTEHMTSDAIAKLANVETGTTLLNFDAEKIEENVQRNPWAGTVHVTRVFPDKLSIQVTERKVGALVLLGSGEVAWYLSADGVWLEPATLDRKGDETAVAAATRLATKLDCLLVTDVPSSVSPKAATAVSDSCMKAVLEYLSGFSKGFRANISSFSAASTESISVTLKSGVEVSLGSTGDISSKEQVIEQILKENPNSVTYINVRTPSSPSFRKVSFSAGELAEGSGARVVDTTSAKTKAATTASSKGSSSEKDQDDASQESGEAQASDEG